MIRTRNSGSQTSNDALRHLPANPGETNVAWLKRAGIRDGILLVGGSSLAHFRLRVAQSHLRSDLLPSFWSAAGILARGSVVHTVSLEWPDAADIPPRNAIRSLRVRALDDPDTFPNVAVIQFTSQPQSVLDGVRRLQTQRSIVDLPKLVLAWLAFVWGSGDQGNPLLSGAGLPSAAMVEAAHALADVELTPGLSSDASCPEAIWLSAKWWQDYYAQAGAGRAGGIVPTGFYTTRQRAAAVFDPTDAQIQESGTALVASRHKARVGGRSRVRRSS
jgi:hypothetical protein